ncbi:hypothetical protein HRbin29_01695 [bacterium HR29]|jgi:DNA-binding PadR family transcriptional regulator|nr:hypothetical protein HRbin29_01695 [bacterium HR29]
MLADRFTQIFREEHRQVRDLLLDLIQAFQDRDLSRARERLGRVAALTGPHFRHEEEALYPALTSLFGDGYVEELFRAHDRAIAGARRLVELAEKAELSEEEVAEAVGIARGILPHVSDCDGLSIMVERLPEERVQAILDRREESLAAGLDLLRWAETVRGR